MATVEFAEVDEYLRRLHDSDPYLALEPNDKDRIFFSAKELLISEFNEWSINARIVALQILYMLEAKEQDFAVYKRQGVKYFSANGTSIDFVGTEISPEVLAAMKLKRGRSGRLI